MDRDRLRRARRWRVRAAWVGLVLALLWFVALMVALSGKCQVTPRAVLEDRGLNPSTAPAPTHEPD
ncbi:MAG TPA: hypothetical protein P5572_05510 [Phycisphaerae bacterium]|nr:hypothetical protein [Phycisphaerae bacterium]